MISITVFEGAVYENGTPVRLSAREAEYIMLAAARYGGLRVPPLPIGAQTRVLVNRIRRRFRGEVLISAGNGRYVFADNVSIDIVKMHLGPEHHDLSLRLAVRRLAANPFRSNPWFVALEPQLAALANAFLQSSL